MTRLACSIVLASLGLVVLVVAGECRAQDPGAIAATADAGNDSEDSEWPRQIDAPTATIIVYQPQLDSDEHDVIEAHSALAVTPTGATEPIFGAVRFKARIETDRDTRECRIFDLKVTSVRFREATPQQEANLAGIIEREAPGWIHPFSMDELLPALEALEKQRVQDERLRSEPPRVIVRTVPALLVPIDGEAKLGPVEGSRIQRVVNTPCALLFEPATKTYWIDGGTSWIHASSVDGPYRVADAVPPEIAAVKTSNEDEAAAAPAAGETPTAAPEIVVTHEPAELIVFDGEPEWQPVVSDELRYATNTSASVLSMASEKRTYVLLSGRWYRAPSLRDGPWELVAPDALPEVFERIPEDSEIGGVLAHVAGTELADEAVLDAQIPQTTAVRRHDARCTVVYDGEPSFEPIPETDLQYAVNTQSQVLLDGGRYYCCDQGVWFVSDAPAGPWSVAEAVPETFQQIPPENPCYNTRYVAVYDVTSDVIHVGYTPGYLGCYCWRGTVVWGTGWRYACWHRGIWYPRFATWGTSVAYNPWLCRWFEGIGFRCRGGWRVGIWPYRGHRFGGEWWGPRGYHRWHHPEFPVHHPMIHRPRVERGAGDDRRQGGLNVYNLPQNRARNARDPIASRPWSRLPDSGRAPRTQPPTKQQPAPARWRNDLFADRDGRIFRRDGDGRWEERTGRRWDPAPVPQKPLVTPPAPRPPAPQRPKLERPPQRPAPTPALQRDAWVRDRAGMRGTGGKKP